MYDWRKMTRAERTRVLVDRRAAKHPRHSPFHIQAEQVSWYHITAACYEHRPMIGHSSDRLSFFSRALLDVMPCGDIRAWVVLPNHYHVLLSTPDILSMLNRLGQLHGRTSFLWNVEDESRGRKVWFRAAETAMKSERHVSVTMNYIHNNPVKHGFCKKWQDWPYSSARMWLEKVGHDEAERFWHEYPVRNYGNDWDI
jgi:Transposase and inactivated derivatives